MHSVWHASRGLARGQGFTLLELLLTLGIATTIIGMAVPLTADALDEMRGSMAARYVQSRILDARMDAVKRSSRVGLRFESQGDDFRFAEYLDGNANGIRSADIADGTDPELRPRERLADQFAGVSFGLRANVPDVDGTRSPTRQEGVRVGVTRILSVGPDGTATSGTLYLHGRRSQYAVRVLGATGRTRVLRFDSGGQQWIAR